MEKNESLGVVSGAYFIGRGQILKWANDFARLNYTKVEQTASGVLTCHVFDALYPGQLRLEKVKFDAKHDYDYVHNYKVLQACFNRVGMKRQIDVQKLIKGKYQDNLEFMQWVKAYFETHATDEAKNYDALGRRQQILGRASLSSSDSSPIVNSNLHKTKSVGTNAAKPSAAAAAKRSIYSSGTNPVVSRMNSQQANKLREEIQKLKTDKEELQGAVEDAVTEREFYFNKLRRVEQICQAATEQVKAGEDSLDFLRVTLEEITTVLYTEDDIPVDEVAEESELQAKGDVVDGQFDDDEDAVYQDANDPQYHGIAPEGNGH